MTIRNKLLVMALVVLAMIGTMAGVTYYRAGSIIEGLVDTAGVEIVKSAAENVDARLNKVEAIVLTAAETVRDAMLRLNVTDEDGVEKIVFCFEIEIQGSLGHARAPRHVVKFRRRVTFIGEQVHRRFDNFGGSFVFTPLSFRLNHRLAPSQSLAARQGGLHEDNDFWVIKCQRT